MKLYGRASSGNCHKVRLALSYLKQPYQLVEIKLEKQHQPAFLALNPFGQVPLLEDAGFNLAESLAILVYLARSYDREDRLLPSDPVAMAQVMRWVAYASNAIHLGLLQLYLIDHLGQPLDRVLALERAQENLSVLDQALRGKDWLELGGPTLADIACYPYVARTEFTGLTLDSFPQVISWVRRFEQLPWFV